MWAQNLHKQTYDVIDTDIDDAIYIVLMHGQYTGYNPLHGGTHV